MWYIDREGKRCAAVVLAVDVMHPPPSYCIHLDGANSSRETEGHRLELRAVTHAPADQPGTRTALLFTSVKNRKCCLCSRALKEVENTKRCASV